MSIRTWIVPRADIPAPPSSGGSGFSFVPSGRSLAALGATPATIVGNLDRLLDPITRDYLRTNTGEWAETADSRTTVLIAMSVPVGESPYDPDQGSAIAARIKAGLGLSPEFLRAETVRVFEGLVRANVLSDVQITVRDQDGEPLRDSAGLQAVRTEWRDLSSGSPATLTLAPR